MNAQLKEMIIFFDLLVMVYTSMGLALLLEGCKFSPVQLRKGRDFPVAEQEFYSTVTSAMMFCIWEVSEAADLHS